MRQGKQHTWWQTYAAASNCTYSAKLAAILICLQNLIYQKDLKILFLNWRNLLFLVFVFNLFTKSNLPKRPLKSYFWNDGIYPFFFFFFCFVFDFCLNLQKRLNTPLNGMDWRLKFFFHLRRAQGDPPCRSQSHNRLCHQLASSRSPQCATTRWPHGSQDDPGNDCDCSATRPMTFNNINSTL